MPWESETQASQQGQSHPISLCPVWFYKKKIQSSYTVTFFLSLGSNNPELWY